MVRYIDLGHGMFIGCISLAPRYGEAFHLEVLCQNGHLNSVQPILSRGELACDRESLLQVLLNVARQLHIALYIGCIPWEHPPPVHPAALHPQTLKAADGQCILCKVHGASLLPAPASTSTSMISQAELMSLMC